MRLVFGLLARISGHKKLASIWLVGTSGILARDTRLYCNDFMIETVRL